MDEELCSTCLSKHRNLIPLAAVKGISSRLKCILVVDAASLLCWECRAVLLRMQSFIDQVSTAQELLKQCVKNQKLSKTLTSLSKLSNSIKTSYDENMVYHMKYEPEDSAEVNDFQSGFKYDEDEEELVPKIEKVDGESQDTAYLSEHADVSAQPCYVSAEDSDDERPLITRARKKKVKNKSDKKKTIPKKDKVEKCDTNEECKTRRRSKEEERFIIKKMSLEEVYRLREEDRKNPRYVSCPFKCETCITGYYSEDKYKTHMELRHSESIGPHSCDICDRRFRSPTTLASHRTAHRRRYHCRACAVITHRLPAMLAHTSQHCVQKFTCKECGVSFLKHRQLRYHREKAHSERVACAACGRRCATRDVLRKHMLLMHGDVAKQTCPQCGRAVRNLRTHLATHAPPAATADAFCVECGQSFRNRQSYQRHLLTHKRHRDEELVLKFECGACALRFSCKTGLQRHMAARHTKQYPFTCDLCSKGFTRRDRLKFHILERHEGGQRPRGQVCSYCGKAFKTKQVLTHHIRTHTGEKPYQCHLCPWSFAQRSTLKTHTRALHGNTGGAGNTSGSGNTGEGGKTDKLPDVQS